MTTIDQATSTNSSRERDTVAARKPHPRDCPVAALKGSGAAARELSQ